MIRLATGSHFGYRMISGPLNQIIVMGARDMADECEREEANPTSTPETNFEALPLMDQLNAIAAVLHGLSSENDDTQAAWYISEVLEGCLAYFDLIRQAADEDGQWVARLLLQGYIQIALEQVPLEEGAAVNEWVDDNLDLEGKSSSLAALAEKVSDRLHGIPDAVYEGDSLILRYLLNEGEDWFVNPLLFSGAWEERLKFNNAIIPKMDRRYRECIMRYLSPAPAKLAQDIKAVETVILDRHFKPKRGANWDRDTDPVIQEKRDSKSA